MVTFVPAGRMGNFLFECATALAYALKHNLSFTVPTTTTDHYWNRLYLQHLANPAFNPGLERIDLWESAHSYQELPFDESWRDKNIFIQGFRQSERYFQEHRSEILYAFDFPYTKKEGYVSVHVRRTDYLHLLNKHPQVGADYYERTMQVFPGMRFKFFSDDIEWCRQTFGGRDNIEFSTNADEVSDLVEAASCEHNICSASTFSFWIYWLNRNPEKIGVFPEKWFVDGYDLETKDILPPEVIKL